MKGWLVGLALVTVLVAASVGLWATWDSTQAPPPEAAASKGEQSIRATTTTERPTTTTTTLPLPPCDAPVEPVATDPGADWATTVVDPTRALPGDFVPPDLVEATEAGFEARDQVRRQVIPDLAALRAGAQANGTPVVVISTYRSYDRQQSLFDAAVAGSGGEAQAELRTARPGHSEHQLGTAVDVLDPGVGELTAAFANTPAGKWVAAHAHEYGFVLSYPKGSREQTCYAFEPWHLRYVGKDVAAQIRESGLTPREWMIARAARAADAG